MAFGNANGLPFHGAKVGTGVSTASDGLVITGRAFGPNIAAPYRDLRLWGDPVGLDVAYSQAIITEHTEVDPFWGLPSYRVEDNDPTKFEGYRFPVNQAIASNSRWRMEWAVKYADGVTNASSHLYFLHFGNNTNINQQMYSAPGTGTFNQNNPNAAVFHGLEFEFNGDWIRYTTEHTLNNASNLNRMCGFATAGSTVNTGTMFITVRSIRQAL